MINYKFKTSNVGYKLIDKPIGNNKKVLVKFLYCNKPFVYTIYLLAHESKSDSLYYKEARIRFRALENYGAIEEYCKYTSNTDGIKYANDDSFIYFKEKEEVVSEEKPVKTIDELYKYIKKEKIILPDKK